MNLSEYISGLRNKSVTVIGMGISNAPLIDLLLDNNINVSVRDKTPEAKLAGAAELKRRGAKLILGDAYIDSIDEDVIFRTPGLHPQQPAITAAVARGAVLTSEMEAFFDVCPCKIIAVTGSDGKTTTTSLVAQLLRDGGYTVHLGGNIGRPLLCDAGSMKADDIAVLELSSFQLLTLGKSADVSVVTNVSPNHLDIHKDLAEYIDAKKNVFRHAGRGSMLVLNYDNETSRAFAAEAPGSVSYFSRTAAPSDGACLDGGDIYVVRGGERQRVMAAADIRMPGVHNVENVLAAFAAVQTLVSAEIMANVAMTFAGVEHRIEPVRELNGVRFFNDSIASSPSRTIAGLRSFPDKVILIAGGKDKGIEYDALAPELIEHVKTLVLTGATAAKIKKVLTEHPQYCGVPRIIEDDDFAGAVRAAYGAAEPGDTVILSPASTSFDKFKNFEERGNVFKRIVNELE